MDIHLRLLFGLLLLSECSHAHKLNRRQIVFGDSDSGSSSTEDGGSDTVSFSDGGSEDKPVPNLVDALSADVAVATRADLGAATPKLQGNACQTPFGVAGVCSFLGEPQCASLVDAISRLGITQEVRTYLLAAIQSPCGFESNDYTLCCQTGSATATPTAGTTPRPTTPPIALATCGESPIGTRIVGGTESVAGDWPWASALGRLTGSTFTLVCGGALITPRHVLTAAHCFRVQGSITHVRLGDHNLGSASDGDTPLDIGVSSVKRHESYSQETQKNDIAIITLGRQVAFTPRVLPVCLPTGSLKGADLGAVGKNPIIIGWGALKTDGPTVSELRQAGISFVPQSQCTAQYSKVQKVSIGSEQVCAGTGATDTCRGDSGGPLLVLDDANRWNIVGVTSFGVECARSDFAGVYTRVDAYLDWIARNTA